MVRNRTMIFLAIKLLLNLNKITSTSLIIVILFVGEKVKSISIYEDAGIIPLIGVIVISYESFIKVNSNSKLIGILFLIWCLYIL